MIASIALAHAATAPPACCIPSSAECELAEALYCVYQQGGPPERAGLDWRGQPCPTWAELVTRAEAGDVGAAGVVAKWRAVASTQGGARISHYQDSWALPCWGELELAGHYTAMGLIRPTTIPGIVEVIEPAVEGDAWHLPTKEQRSLRPFRGPMFRGFTRYSAEYVVKDRLSHRKKRPLSERRAATDAAARQIVPGLHCLVEKDWEGNIVRRIVTSVDPPAPPRDWWIVRFADGDSTTLSTEGVTVIPIPPELAEAAAEAMASKPPPSATTQEEHDWDGDTTDPESEPPTDDASEGPS